jgi:hypothetical protein
MVGAAAGVFIFYRGFLLLQRKRLIMNTPASKVRSAAMGLVEISGLAAGPYSLVAPITGRACYYYRTLVWQWKRQGKSESWVKEADVSLHVPFYLEDNTGRVLVNPQSADMDIHCDFKEEFSHSIFSSNLEIPANITNFLLMHGVGTDKKIKIEEYCIKPKNALFILGTLAHNPGLSVSGTPVQTMGGRQLTASFSLQSLLQGVTLTNDTAEPMFAVASRPVLDKAQQEKVSAAMMKAGITSPLAWAVSGVNPVATVAVGAQGAAAAPALEQFDLHPSTVLMKGSQNPAFFISWRSQRDVVKGLGWKSALMIWGGPPLTLLCVYILAMQYGWL